MGICASWTLWNGCVLGSRLVDLPATWTRHAGGSRGTSIKMPKLLCLDGLPLLTLSVDHQSKHSILISLFPVFHRAMLFQSHMWLGFDRLLY